MFIHRSPGASKNRSPSAPYFEGSETALRNPALPAVAPDHHGVTLALRARTVTVGKDVAATLADADVTAPQYSGLHSSPTDATTSLESDDANMGRDFHALRVDVPIARGKFPATAVPEHLVDAMSVIRTSGPAGQVAAAAARLASMLYGRSVPLCPRRSPAPFPAAAQSTEEPDGGACDCQSPSPRRYVMRQKGFVRLVDGARRGG
jgi:hypothetical protein